MLGFGFCSCGSRSTDHSVEAAPMSNRMCAPPFLDRAAATTEDGECGASFAIDHFNPLPVRGNPIPEPCAFVPLGRLPLRSSRPWPFSNGLIASSAAGDRAFESPLADRSVREMPRRSG